MQFFSYSECSGGLISELSKQKQKVEFLEVVGYFALTFVMIFLVFCLFYFFSGFLLGWGVGGGWSDEV